VLSLLLATAVLLLLVAPGAAAETAFSDVPDGAPFAEDIAWLTAGGLAAGYADGSFRPAAPVSRQALASFLYRHAHDGAAPPPCSDQWFGDVPTSSPFCGAVAWLVGTGIATGYTDGSFRPDAPVSRQATAAFLQRYRAAAAPTGTTCQRSLFPDMPDNGFCDEVTWLASSGIATGYQDGLFRPAAAVSRQAIAAYLHRYDEAYGPSRPTGGIVPQRLPLAVAPPGTQVVTVVASSAAATVATLTAWQWGPTGWSRALGPVSARVGSAGIGAASEYVSRTPAGTHGLTEAFGRAANPGTALPYRAVDGNDWWVSDVDSPRYNQYARCAPGTCDFDERRSENLYRAGAVYDHAVVIDYNRAGLRGAGSAFFLHVTNGQATAGCVAVDAAQLQALMRWLDPHAAPVVAIGVA